MVTMGVFPFQGKTHMVDPGIEPGTSWLVVRNSDHQSHEAGRETLILKSGFCLLTLHKSPKGSELKNKKTFVYCGCTLED